MARKGDWSDYEWDIEEVQAVDAKDAEENEVLGHNFLDSAAEGIALLQKGKPSADERFEMVLVLTTDSGRSWAYVDMDAMTLPEYFCDAAWAETRKVPKKFHAELAKAIKNS
jgi:hypothetical protein